MPAESRACLAVLSTQLEMIKEQILDNDRRILADARNTEAGRRLMKIPGIGPLLASAIVACVPDPSTFGGGRSLSAWIGLTPRQNSSGGKERLGSITKAGKAALLLAAHWFDWLSASAQAEVDRAALANYGAALTATKRRRDLRDASQLEVDQAEAAQKRAGRWSNPPDLPRSPARDWKPSSPALPCHNRRPRCHCPRWRMRGCRSLAIWWLSTAT